MVLRGLIELELSRAVAQPHLVPSVALDFIAEPEV
jgi:hypothetical protein